MNKITKYQLCAMLLIPDAFMLLCIHGELSVMRIAAVTVGILIQAVMALPIAVYFSKGGELSEWASVLFLIYVIFCGGMLVSRFIEAAGALYIPYENSDGLWGSILIFGLAALVCLYMSSSGIKALARASVIAAAVGALYLIVLAVSAVTGANYENLARAGESRSFIGDLAASFPLGGGLGGLIVLSGLTEEKPLKSVLGYFAARAVMSAAVLVSAILVEGSISSISDFPVITAAQLSQPFSSQRIDSLLLIIFAVFAVFSIAIQSAAASYLMQELFPKSAKLCSAAAIALIIGAAFIMSFLGLSYIAAAAAAMVAVFIVPCILLIALKTASRAR